MKKKNMRLSIVIPAYNEEHYLGPCLESIFAHAAGKFLEIIIVDNASTDSTAEIAAGFPGVRVIREEEKGVTRARQRGYREARGDVIAYLDADTRIWPGWFGIMNEVLSRNPEIVSLSGPYRYYDGSRNHRILMHCAWWLSAPLTYRMTGYMVLGGNFAVRKWALEATGGFDPAIEFYGEDTDIARRLRAYGKVVFRMDFFVYSSSRRFAAEGFVGTNMKYAVNFLWEALFGRPFTRRYRDIRVPSEKKADA